MLETAYKEAAVRQLRRARLSLASPNKSGKRELRDRICTAVAICGTAPVHAGAEADGRESARRNPPRSGPSALPAQNGKWSHNSFAPGRSRASTGRASHWTQAPGWDG